MRTRSFVAFVTTALVTFAAPSHAQTAHQPVRQRRGYEGRPSATQLQRTDAIGRETAEVKKGFDAWVAKEMPGINAALAAHRLPSIPDLIM